MIRSAPARLSKCSLPVSERLQKRKWIGRQGLSGGKKVHFTVFYIALLTRLVSLADNAAISRRFQSDPLLVAPTQFYLTPQTKLTVLAKAMPAEPDFLYLENVAPVIEQAPIPQTITTRTNVLATPSLNARRSGGIFGQIDAGIRDSSHPKDSPADAASSTEGITDPVRPDEPMRDISENDQDQLDEPMLNANPKNSPADTAVATKDVADADPPDEAMGDIDENNQDRYDELMPDVDDGTRDITQGGVNVPRDTKIGDEGGSGKRRRTSSSVRSASEIFALDFVQSCLQCPQLQTPRNFESMSPTTLSP